MSRLSYAVGFIFVFNLLLLHGSVSADTGSAYDRAVMTEVEHLESLVQQHERNAGLYTLELYGPLKALGTLQLEHGFYEQAIDTFRRMQHLTHRGYGVNSHQQLESIEYLLRGYAKQRDYLTMEALQHFRYRIASQEYKPDEVPHLAATLKLADWYRNTGRHTRALGLYTEAKRSILDDPGVEVRILRSEALTNYLAGKCCATERLQEALHIVLAHPAETNLDSASALQDYANISSLEQKELASDLMSRSQPPEYLGFKRSEDIIRLMSLTKPTDFRSKTYVDFGERDPDEPAISTVGYPVSMCSNTLKQLVTRPRESLEVEVSMTINTSGRPNHIEISGDAPHRLKRYLKDSLSTGVYRAATDKDGNLVNAELSFRQTFAEQTVNVTSNDSVNLWSRVLVAQACQTQGVQRI